MERTISTGIGGELSSFMRKCFVARLSTSESINAGKDAVLKGKLSSRAKVFLNDYQAIRNCREGFKASIYEAMETHADLLNFHRKHTISRYNDLLFGDLVEKDPHAILSLCAPYESISSTGKKSSCFIISSPKVLDSFMKLHNANVGYGWHCKCCKRHML